MAKKRGLAFTRCCSLSPNGGGETRVLGMKPRQTDRQTGERAVLAIPSSFMLTSRKMESPLFFVEAELMKPSEESGEVEEGDVATRSPPLVVLPLSMLQCWLGDAVLSVCSRCCSA